MTKREGDRVIIKLGGSLIERGREIIRFLRDYVEEKDKALTIILIPGGGPFVEVVRNLSANISISEETAHWMAVLAMHQYGFFLANGEIRIPVVESMNKIDGEPIRILLPYEMLKADDCLPHTWDVTSDTIAAFVANKIGEKTFIKLTDVDGIIDEKGHLIREIYAEEMVELEERKGCVDTELPRFLMQNKMNCIIVNGNFPDRIIAAIEGKETRCTKILSIRTKTF